MSEAKDGSIGPEVKNDSRFNYTIRMVNRMGISSLFIGVGIAVIKAWATYWLGPGEPVRTLPEKTAAVAQAEPVAALVTVEDLLKTSPVSLMEWQVNAEQRYESSAQRERPFREYIGKNVVWEGYFGQLNPVKDTESGAAKAVLILHESRSTLFEKKKLLGPPFVRCWLPAEAVKDYAGVEKGDWVVVRGKLGDPLLAGSALCTDLMNCEVIATNQVRAVETALEASEPVVR